MARVTETTTGTTGSRTEPPTSVRGEFARFGHRWSRSLTQLIALSVQLDESGEWALDGSPTCAHWIAASLDIEVGTAREWLRIGRALTDLPVTSAAFESGDLSFTKVRALTRLATAANEVELVEIAGRTPAGQLGTALAAWSARHEDEATRRRRHRRHRGLRWRTDPDGSVSFAGHLTPEQAAVLTTAIDTQVMRSGGRDLTERENGATGSRGSHRQWSTLAQQRVDALVHLVSNGGVGTTAEVILHVRADGCTLDDGTPITNSGVRDIVEHLADTTRLRAMIHDAESNPVNVSGRHRHHTDRQKRVVKERDRRCVDCGSDEFTEYDHVPDYDLTRRTLVDETELRCGRCHRNRHRRS